MPSPVPATVIQYVNIFNLAICIVSAWITQHQPIDQNPTVATLSVGTQTFLQAADIALPVFERGNLSEQQCRTLNSTNCREFFPTNCVIGFYGFYCNGSAGDAEMSRYFDDISRVLPASAIMLKIGGRTKLTPDTFSTISRIVAVFQIALVDDFHCDMLIRLPFRNLLQLSFVQSNRIILTSHSLEPFSQLRVLFFENSTILFLEKGVLDSLVSLKVVAFDWRISPPFTTDQRAYLWRLHCSGEYSWLRQYLLQHPQLIQPRKWGEVVPIQGIENAKWTRRMISYPVDCNKDDLTGDDNQVAFSINDEQFINQDSSISSNITVIVAKKFSTGSTIGVAVGVIGFTTLIAALAIAYCKWRRRRRSHRRPSTHSMTPVSFSNLESVALSRELELLEVPRATVSISGRLLGKGSFGVVYQGVARNLPYQKDVTTVAVKYSVESSTVSAATFYKEISIMAEMGRHLNIVNLLGVVVKGEQLMLLEYCQLGSLYKYLKDHRGTCFYRHVDDSGTLLDFDQEQYNLLKQQHDQQLTSEANEDFDGRILSSTDLINFSYQITRGMVFLVSKHIVHRDLAARNVLLSDNLVAKISDFGMAIRNAEIGPTYPLPVKWTAPEAIRLKKFSEKSDVWSYGVLLWEIFSLSEKPYSNVEIKGNVETLLQLLESGYRMEKPAQSFNQMYDLMQKCWTMDENSRPTFSAVRIELQTLTDEDKYLELDNYFDDYNFHLESLS